MHIGLNLLLPSLMYVFVVLMRGNVKEEPDCRWLRANVKVSILFVCFKSFFLFYYSICGRSSVRSRSLHSLFFFRQHIPPSSVIYAHSMCTLCRYDFDSFYIYNIFFGMSTKYVVVFMYVNTCFGQVANNPNM